MEAFPNPSNSPAHHTRSLTISSPEAIATAGLSARAWIRTFHHIVALSVETTGSNDSQVSLAPTRIIAYS